MSDYTVRYHRGNRDWTCSVFLQDKLGTAVGTSVASGTGRTQADAKDMALTLTSDPAIRAALLSSDHRRPYWLQGTLGEAHDARRNAARPEVVKKRLPR